MVPFLFSVPASETAPAPLKLSVPTSARGSRKLPLLGLTLVEATVNPHTPFKLAVVNCGWLTTASDDCAHPRSPAAISTSTARIGNNLLFVTGDSPKALKIALPHFHRIHQSGRRTGRTGIDEAQLLPTGDDQEAQDGAAADA